MSTSSLVRGDSADNSHVELIPITPKLLAMNRASAQAIAIPDALLTYQPEPYRIGPGDSLYITVWDHPELTSPAGPQQATIANGRLVRSDGTLFYPYIGGPLRVAGMTIEELREAITKKLATYVAKPQVDVSVVGYGSQRVLLQGAFMKTDPQPITAVPLTLTLALGIATINTEQANLSGLVLSRDGHDYHLDLDALNSDRNVARDIYLKPGDRLFLPYNDRQEAYVVGEVNHPLAIRFKTSDLTLNQALGRAGGLNETTSKGKAVYVIRGVEDLEQAPAKVFQLDARSPVAFALASQFKVKPGDVVFVGPAGVTRWNRLLSQLLPVSGLISSAASANYELGH
ncbi:MULTISPECIES: polysaccharide biosynthesis/export family protein [unclassified Rhodanobacter]|uniref:polysaccharide biosynthesis/export family protein n=1 Tax=unclassified Rhodanobacter TaxID=2621553 RepID=UPI000984203D|nr:MULTISPECIES: polysaccharide biosynthesis/export family protein [unclassified Rhodanobacter]OOG37800.1 capsular biosynthesis protein [Rhodanobacter sp. C05]OOG66460.1 capsular biosynthesis protein [Rhodanobacter sp. B04]